VLHVIVKINVIFYTKRKKQEVEKKVA